MKLVATWKFMIRSYWWVKRLSNDLFPDKFWGCTSGGVYIFTQCQVRVTVGESSLCCCICVTSFEHWLTPLCQCLFQTILDNIHTNHTEDKREPNRTRTYVRLFRTRTYVPSVCSSSLPQCLSCVVVFSLSVCCFVVFATVLVLLLFFSVCLLFHRLCHSACLVVFSLSVCCFIVFATVLVSFSSLCRGKKTSTVVVRSDSNLRSPFC